VALLAIHLERVPMQQVAPAHLHHVDVDAKTSAAAAESATSAQRIGQRSRLALAERRVDLLTLDELLQRLPLAALLAPRRTPTPRSPAEAASASDAFDHADDARRREPLVQAVQLRATKRHACSPWSRLRMQRESRNGAFWSGPDR
jgi:hypothetical protein